ncbi:iron-containing alcohol dehydrogenase [Actibacterium atlanticum]|uniref:Iron-containing alcohol dehydrogenase n=1 Tax=Actibacterium atlanticum TaxID=1461693 RepID=A0A058ZMG6_9RHOB|nr:iron-containing alcohol dehydrogenase [Actibacterium atlanticum]KCV82430.1 iron-containing alcohol dehydrogenase [Actibacterium atlanticum]
MLPATRFSISLPTRVQFGDGQRTALVRHLPKAEGVVAFVRGQSGAASNEVSKDLRNHGFVLNEVICPKEPTVASVNNAVRSLEGLNVVAVVACGGGSVLDTGKALKLCLSAGVSLSDDLSNVPESVLERSWPLPLIAVPTTAGTGAEVTANAVLGLPSAQTKLSLRGLALCPDVALVDPLLLQGAPVNVLLHAALDAVVQSIEAFCSSHATPFTDGLVASNLELSLRAMRSVQDTNATGPRRNLAWTALCSGIALANGGLGAVHGLASVLGGRYDAPHGALCGRLLAPVLRRNLAKTAPGSVNHVKIDHCVEAIGQVYPPHAGADELSGFEAWLAANNLPRLRAFGLRKQDFEDISAKAIAASSSRKNPVTLEAEDFQIILDAAH